MGVPRNATLCNFLRCRTVIRSSYESAAARRRIIEVNGASKNAGKENYGPNGGVMKPQDRAESRHGHETAFRSIGPVDFSR